LAAADAKRCPMEEGGASVWRRRRIEQEAAVRKEGITLALALGMWRPRSGRRWVGLGPNKTLGSGPPESRWIRLNQIRPQHQRLLFICLYQ
jgi:hypothetical protein